MNQKGVGNGSGIDIWVWWHQKKNYLFCSPGKEFNALWSKRIAGRQMIDWILHQSQTFASQLPRPKQEQLCRLNKVRHGTGRAEFHSLKQTVALMFGLIEGNSETATFTKTVQLLEMIHTAEDFRCVELNMHFYLNYNTAQNTVCTSRHLEWNSATT